MDPDLDRLAHTLGRAGAEQVARWAAQVGADLRYGGWEDRGNTAARLVAVYATWEQFGDTPAFSGKLIMKFVPAHRRETKEARRTADAWNSCPPGFRERHLVRQRRDPVMLERGGWLLFLDVAAGNLSEIRSLATLLEGPELAKASEHAAVAIGEALAEWNGDSPAAEYPTVRSHLRALLEPRLDEGGTVLRWATEQGLVAGSPARATEVEVAGLPNPLGLVLGDHPASDEVVRVRVGNSHGDLHPGNLLCGTEPGRFWLIDQARFDRRRALAFDPAYLLVTTVAQLLPKITSALERDELIQLLTDPGRSRLRWVPTPVYELVTTVAEAAAVWGARHNLAEEWRAESLVSLIACALIMTGRDLIPARDRGWFLRLAAHAANLLPGAKTSATSTTGAGGQPTGRSSPEGVDEPLPEAEPVLSFAEPAPSAAGASTAPGVPPPPPHAVDRTGVMSALEERLEWRSGGVLVLAGPAGVGKTQLAAEYFRRHAAGYTGAFWVSGEDTSLLWDQFADIARALGVPVIAESDPAAVRRALVEALRERGGTFLVVVDGVDRVAAIRTFLPMLPTTRVLVTSRSARWTQLAEVLAVDRFERRESVRLLTGLAGDQDGLDDLAAALDDLPSSVHVAGAHMARGAMSARQYLDLVRGRTRASRAPREATLEAVWTQAVDRLRRDHPAAAELVELLAFFGPAPVPVDVLTSGRDALPLTLAAATADRKVFDEAARVAAGFALLGVASGLVVTYSPFRRFVRARTPPDRAEELRRRVRIILAARDPGDPRDPATWIKYHSLVPHVVAADLAAAEHESCRRLHLAVVRYLIARGDPAAALDLAQRARARWRVDLGEDSEPVLEAMTHIAQALFYAGDRVAAAQVDGEVLNRTRRWLGDDHPMTVIAEQNAATSRMAADSHGDELLFKGVVDRTRSVFGPDHRETLRAVHNLGHELRSCGRPDRALQLDRDNHQRLQRTLGPQHLDTLRSGHALALDLRGLGEHDEATLVAEHVHRSLQDLLGEAHPDTAQAAMNLAEGRRQAGEADRAEELDSAAHDALTTIHGPDHPLTLLAAHGLAKDLLALGQGEQAARLAEDTCQRRARVLGAGHLDTIRSTALLARSLRRTGDEEAAAEADARARRLLADLVRSRP